MKELEQGRLPGWRHERGFGGKTDEWITPRWILTGLGDFDLDPCASIRQPWPCAKRSLTEYDNGLSAPWQGRVFLNPPYGPATTTWLRRAHQHGNVIALVFARVETKWFHEEVFDKANGVLFLKGRVGFCRPDGSETPGAGAGSCLVAYGTNNLEVLKQSGLIGCVIALR